MISKELGRLQAYIEGLETKEKLDYLLKLVPYVLPKVSSVDHDEGEPVTWSA